MAYATLNNVKRFCNMDTGDTDLDDLLNTHLVNADAYINTQIELHAVVPVVGDSELPGLADYLAAATHNYWTTPAKDRVIEGMKQWEERIQHHILAKYGKRNPTGLTGSSYSKTGSAVTGKES